MSNLPKGWVLTKLAEVIEPYDTIDPKQQPERRFSYVDISSIDNRVQRITETKEFYGRDAPSRARRVIKSGDVLFATVRIYLKNIAVALNELDGELTSTGIIPLRPNKAIMSEYLFNWVRSDHFIESISKFQSGTLYPAIPDKDVLAAEIAIPPLAEQKQIVTKLNNLTSRTANARVALEHIPALIESYKQATLRKAFNGDLIADTKKKESSLSKRVRLGDVVSSIRYGTAKKSYPEKNGTAVLRIPNVSGGYINHVDLKYTIFDDKELSNLALELGDILVVRSNGSSDLVGRSALVTQTEVGLAYAGYLIRLRPHMNKINPEYLRFMLESPQIRKIIKLIARSSNGIHNINSKELARLEIPCPELNEQIEIVHRIESAFAWLDRISGEHIAASKLLSELDASILQKAFRGELIPQNPHDEPASILLERIKNKSKVIKEKIKPEGKAAVLRKKVVRRRAEVKNLIEVLKASEDWVSASDAAQALGIDDGATSDMVEGFYNELRVYLQNGDIIVERRGDEDWLRLRLTSGR